MKRSLLLLASTTICAACIAAGVMSSGGLPAANPEFKVRSLRDGQAQVIIGGGSNSLLFKIASEPAELILLDPKFERHSSALAQQITKLDPAPLRYLIASHHHEETAGGIPSLRNGKLGSSAATVILHDAVDRRLRALHGANGGGSLHFRSRLTLELADGEVLTLHHKGPGHSEGDTVAHFANARILAVGGLASHRTHPSFDAGEDGGDLRRWIRCLDDLVRDFGNDKDLLVVPADGEPGGIDILRDQVSYLRDVLEWMEDAQSHGQTLNEALAEAQPLREKYRDFRGPERFETLLKAAYRTAGGGR